METEACKRVSTEEDIECNNNSKSSVSWVTDDASEVLERDLERFGVSDELSAVYRADRMYQRLIYKSNVEVVRDNIRSSLTFSQLNVDKLYKKKKKRASTISKFSDSDETSIFIMKKVKKLGEKGSISRGNFVDPVQEESNKRKPKLTIKEDSEEDVAKSEPEEISKGHILHFYTQSKRISDVNKYIKYINPENEKRAEAAALKRL